MKRLFISLLLISISFFSGFISLYAQGTPSRLMQAAEEYNKNPSDPAAKKAYMDAKKEAQEVYEQECEASGDCLEQPSWKLNVSSFVPGNTFSEEGLEERADELFSRIIKSLMVALGVLSVFIMTIGGGYMILHNGQDELLNKGKSIFMAGIYAMTIALLAYFLVDIIANILYKMN